MYLTIRYLCHFESPQSPNRIGKVSQVRVYTHCEFSIFLEFISLGMFNLLLFYHVIYLSIIFISTFNKRCSFIVTFFKYFKHHISVYFVFQHVRNEMDLSIILFISLLSNN